MQFYYYCCSSGSFCVFFVDFNKCFVNDVRYMSVIWWVFYYGVEVGFFGKDIGDFYFIKNFIQLK